MNKAGKTLMNKAYQNDYSHHIAIIVCTVDFPLKLIIYDVAHATLALLWLVLVVGFLQ